MQLRFGENWQELLTAPEARSSMDEKRKRAKEFIAQLQRPISNREFMKVQRCISAPYSSVMEQRFGPYWRQMLDEDENVEEASRLQTWLHTLPSPVSFEQWRSSAPAENENRNKWRGAMAELFGPVWRSPADMERVRSFVDGLQVPISHWDWGKVFGLRNKNLVKMWDLSMQRKFGPGWKDMLPKQIRRPALLAVPESRCSERLKLKRAALEPPPPPPPTFEDLTTLRSTGRTGYIARNGKFLFHNFMPTSKMCCYACIVAGRKCEGRSAAVPFSGAGRCSSCVALKLSPRACITPGDLQINARLCKQAKLGRWPLHSLKRQRIVQRWANRTLAKIGLSAMIKPAHSSLAKFKEKAACHVCGAKGQSSHRRCFGCLTAVCNNAECMRKARVVGHSSIFFCCQCLGCPWECDCTVHREQYYRLILKTLPPQRLYRFLRSSNRDLVVGRQHPAALETVAESLQNPRPRKERKVKRAAETEANL